MTLETKIKTIRNLELVLILVDQEGQREVHPKVKRMIQRKLLRVKM